MNLNKDPESWARVSPASVLDGSRGQAENVLAMAIEDIGRLSKQSRGEISLRDHFAAHFMSAASAQAGYTKEHDLQAMFGSRIGLRTEEIAAALAYRMADAMLARRMMKP